MSCFGKSMVAPSVHLDEDQVCWCKQTFTQSRQFFANHAYDSKAACIVWHKSVGTLSKLLVSYFCSCFLALSLRCCQPTVHGVLYGTRLKFCSSGRHSLQQQSVMSRYCLCHQLVLTPVMDPKLAWARRATAFSPLTDGWEHKEPPSINNFSSL